MGSNAMKTIMAPVVCAFVLAGCSGMSDTQQRALSGTAIGAGGGAILGAIGGNAALGAVAGAGAGLIGGLIYDNVKKNEQASYQQGYNAAATPHQHRPAISKHLVSYASAVHGRPGTVDSNARDPSLK